MEKEFEVIKSLFREQLDLIKDKKLAEKVVNCWVIGMKEGNWNPDDLNNLPFTIALEGKTDINLVEHTIAVTMAAYQMAQAEKKVYGHKKDYLPVNCDYLVAGGLLHDVGKLVEIEPDGQGYFRKSQTGKSMRHPIYGAKIASQEGLPDEVINSIAYHSREGDGKPRTKETRLILHADFAFYESIKEPF